jgi:hypothetical protein
MGKMVLLLGLGLVAANVLVGQQGAALLEVLGIRKTSHQATLFSSGVLPLATPTNAAGLAPLNPQPATSPVAGAGGNAAGSGAGL